MDKPPKIMDVKILPTYSCQKCGLPFVSGFERVIVTGQEPFCPKCTLIWRKSR